MIKCLWAENFPTRKFKFLLKGTFQQNLYLTMSLKFMHNYSSMALHFIILGSGGKRSGVKE